MSGKVWLVGAGPGDPELITVRGREALAEAEVVVYDESVNPELLQVAPDRAEVLNAGTQPPLHVLTDDEITALLVARAAEGKRVVRLYGGDPFVFELGVREAEALARAGLSFEIVPGVTASVAAPAYAGIPIVHPDIARSYSVLTGDAASTAADSSVPWPALARATDTLIFVHAAENLPALADLLIRHGRPAATPAAVIRWGTDAPPLTVVDDLDRIAGRVAAAGLRSPAITVVGEVVRLRERLRWYDDRPLFGRRVLLTRTRRGASAIRRLLQAEGAEVIELPTHEVVDLVAPEILGRVADALTDGYYGWVIFSSARSVEIFFRRLLDLGRDARALHAAQLLAIGGETVDALAGRGLRADVTVDDPSSEGIVAKLGRRGLARRRVLLPRTEETQQDLLAALRRAGSEVEDVPLYVAAVPRQPDREALGWLRRREIEAVVFPAASAVRNLLGMLGSAEPLRGVPVACISPIAAEAAAEAGLGEVAVAESPTPAGVVRALSDAVARRSAVGTGRG